MFIFCRTFHVETNKYVNRCEVVIDREIVTKIRFLSQGQVFLGQPSWNDT